MGHDQRFKDFLHAFLQEFLQLFFPEVEKRLDFREVEFLDKEVFADFAEGRFRRADVVAKIKNRDGTPELVVIHIEVQARIEADFGKRMFEYYALLSVRKRLPVFPIVIHLSGGNAGRTRETYRAEIFGEEVVRFRYPSIQLARLDGEEYRKGVGPVGAALAALMDLPRASGRAELKADLLLEVIRGGLDEARQLLLANLVETYMELTEKQEQEYRRVISRKEYEAVQEVRESWMDKLLRQGKEAGLEEGQRAGREEGQRAGREEGQKDGKRAALLALMRQKFGALDRATTSRVSDIDSEEELDRLLSAMLTATRLQDLELEPRS